MDPHELPQRCPVRHHRRAHVDRRRGRVRRALQQARPRSDAPPGRAARRPAPGAVAVQPLPQPARRPRAPQRGPPEDGGQQVHHPGGGQRGDRRPARAQARIALHEAPRALLLRLCPGEADRALRRRRVPPRRAEGPHDDQPEDAGPGARRRQRVLRGSERSVVGHRRHRPGQRRHQGDGLDGHLQEPPLQPRRPRPSPAGIDVQDDGAHRRRPPGRRPRVDQLRLEAAQPQRARLWPVEGEDVRQHLWRVDEPRAGDAGVRQQRLRPADHRHRAEEGLRDGQADGHHDEARLFPRRGPRRPAARRDPRRDGQRLRDARLGWGAPPSDRHPQGRVPRRQVGDLRLLEGQAGHDRRRRPTRSRRSSSRT